MITYSKSLGGFWLIFRCIGTSWPSGIIPGLVASAISLILGYLEDVDDVVRPPSDFISNTYAFQLFAYLLGILMVFRTNFAYNRYWEAVGMVQAMAAKWLDGACMGIVFDAGGSNEAPLLHGANEFASKQPHVKHANKGGLTHVQFFAEIVHLCSLLHAVALQHLRQDSDLDNLEYAPVPWHETDRFCNGSSVDAPTSPTRELSSSSVSGRLKRRVGLADFSQEGIAEVLSQQQLPVLGGLSDAERQALETHIAGVPLSTEARVAMVEGWFMRRLIARQKFEQGDSCDTSPPILSRLYQVISDGSLWFAHASKIAITPFPFPYHNLLSILLWVFTFLVPVVVNGIIKETGIRVVFSFLPAFAYQALAAVGDNIEDPFLPYDVNELPLPELQKSVNSRLIAFGIVPLRPTPSSEDISTLTLSPETGGSDKRLTSETFTVPSLELSLPSSGLTPRKMPQFGQISRV